MTNITDKYGTGFENGGDISSFVDQSANSANLSMDASAKTGDWALRIATGASTSNDAGINVPDDVTNEVYFSVWINASGANKGLRVGVELDDGTRVYVQKDAGAGNLNYDGYRNGTALGGTTGSETLSAGAYDLLELRIKIANSGGVFNFSLNGVSDWSFSGDTQPSASSTISYVYVQVTDAAGDFCRVDDWTIYTSSAPGDIRYIRLNPNGDTATVEWDKAFPADDNYEQVFEHPLDTGDYVYTSASGTVDLYTLDNYTEGKQVVLFTQYVAAAYLTTASDIKIKLVSGVTTDTDSARALTTFPTHYRRVLDTDPNTGSFWLTAGLNAVTLGQEANVGSGGTVRCYQHIVEVGYNQTTEGTFTGIRPGGISVDTTDATNLYTATWNDGTMYVERATLNDLVQKAQVSFGGCTSDEWDARTFRVNVLAPPFGNESYVYAFGRWNLSGIEHIRLSTDGGATYNANIGDSGTWASGTVSEMFAISEQDIFAFVDGGSPALYRTTNGGTSWTLLSTLPFEVKAASLSADGLIVICNRNTGEAQQVAVSNSDFTTWTDITNGLPTTGMGSVVWI